MYLHTYTITHIFICNMRRGETSPVTYTNMYVYTYMYIYMYICMYTYTYSHIFICTYTQRGNQSSARANGARGGQGANFVKFIHAHTHGSVGIPEGPQEIRQGRQKEKTRQRS